MAKNNKIILVRHGQTVWNLEKITQGWLDSPLTKLGIAQAEAAAKKLKNQQIDIIISSPLGRALQTAEIISKILNTTVLKTDDSLMERNLGILQGKTKEESLKKFPNFWTPDGKFIQSSSVPDGESLAEFLNRTTNFVEKLKTIAKSKRLIVVTHDGVLHAIVGIIKQIPFEKVQQYYTFNCGEPIIFEIS